MILTPDYLWHWKIQLLVRMAGDKNAEIYPIRLYLYCNQRKQWVFDRMTKEKFASIISWDGDAEQIWATFVSCELFYIDDAGNMVVQGFYDQNLKLCKNWVKGPSGGRPLKPVREGGKVEHNPNDPEHNPNAVEHNPNDPEHNPNGKKQNLSKTDRVDSIDRENLMDRRFDDFWAIYPKRKSKKLAHQKWIKFECDDFADQVIASVAAHLKTKDWIKDDGQFIPHPATYINQAMWDDELPEAKGPTPPPRYEGS